MKTKPTCFVVALLLSLETASWVQAASTIQFVKNGYTVLEWAGTVSLTVQRTNDINTVVSVDYATADGSATSGLKYTATNGTLAFAAGETNKTVVVQVLNEGFVGGSKTFMVTLSNPTNAFLGALAIATVSISDIDVGIQFQFASYNTANGWSWAEDVGAVLIGVVRGDDANFPVTVDFATSDLTATNGLHYIGLTNTLSFAPQERLKFVPITILNDTLKQPNRSFRATLMNPVGLTLGAAKTTTVSIIDNDQGFQFESTTYSGAEDAGVALIGVLRGTDDSSSTITVDLATADVRAVNGLDYTGMTNTLSFVPGERRKVVSIPILNDGVTEGTAGFRVTLSNPGGGAVLGLGTNTTVSILDNDPGVGLELTSYSTAWGPVEEFAVTVLRGNDGALGPIAVDYATSDGTAKAGEDYQAISGTLTFKENETVKSLTIPIMRSRSAKNFRVTLSNPTNGAMLWKSTTTVGIDGIYATVAPPFDTALTIRREGGVNVLTWSGGGALQRADSPTGPWQTLANAKSPYIIRPSIPTTFYRVTLPRPASLYVPSSYNGQTKMPLVLFLHGYGGTGAFYEPLLQIEPLAEARGFLFCYPTGTLDRMRLPYWNGIDTNDLWSDHVDDAGYLRALIETISSQFVVDPKRVYVMGHSTGGDMTFTVACQSADLIAGIASVAGNSFLDPSRCQPSNLVNVLSVCGTQDAFNVYYGGAVEWLQSHLPAYPGAVRSAQIWAAYNGARDPDTDLVRTMDISTEVPGLDTIVTRYMTYPAGGAVELWSIINGTHGSALSTKFSPRVIDWLFAHPKP